MMQKILFLHGFFASGNCVPALTLRKDFEEKLIVLTPDLPLRPQLAIQQILTLCEQEHPDLLVGNSCGSFYAQLANSMTGIPALLGNPYFLMSEFLEARIGTHQYKSPRKDGQQEFVIDTDLIEAFKRVESHQFDHINEEHREMVWGLFGTHDTLAHFEPMFLQYYRHSHHFPGAHTPTAEEVTQWYEPLIIQMLHLKLSK